MCCTKTCSPNCPAKCEVPFWSPHWWNIPMIHCPSSLFSSSNTTLQIRTSGKLVCGKKAPSSHLINLPHCQESCPTRVQLQLLYCYSSIPLLLHHATACYCLPSLLHHVYSLLLFLFSYLYYTMLSLFFCYCSTSTTITPCYSLSLPFSSIIYPHSTRNYPATTLPVFLFHILHHCFRAHCVKPVLTSDGKRPPPLHPPTPFFLSHFSSPLGFKSNLSMSRINIRIETLVTKAKALRGEVWLDVHSNLSQSPLVST